MTDHTTEQPSAKLCECGCGRITSIATKTSKRDGTTKGHPLRFIHGHNQRKPASQRKQSPSKKNDQITAPSHKVCTKCGKYKPISEYTKSGVHRWGHNSRCKSCLNMYNRERRKRPENIESVRMQRRQWRQRAKLLGLLKPSQHKRPRPYAPVAAWYNKNPGARAAHQSVHKAVSSGLMPKITDRLCDKCGNPACHYHHHRGYSVEHRLDVIPLCATCHRGTHQS